MPSLICSVSLSKRNNFCFHNVNVNTDNKYAFIFLSMDYLILYKVSKLCNTAIVIYLVRCIRLIVHLNGNGVGV